MSQTALALQLSEQQSLLPLQLLPGGVQHRPLVQGPPLQQSPDVLQKPNALEQAQVSSSPHCSVQH